MANLKKKLPRFTASKGIIALGRTWNAIFSRIETWRPRSGRNIYVEETDDGAMIHAILPPPPFPPFYPLLEYEITDGVRANFVRVTPGMVIERLVTQTESSDAIRLHVPDNLWEEGTTLKRHPINIGQAVAVKCQVKASGQIEADEGAAVDLIIGAPADMKTQRYIPIVEEDEGADGTYYYRLATLVDGPEGPYWEMANGGSNIDHFQDLPSYGTDEGARVFRKFDPEQGKYLLRGLVAGAGITIEETDTAIRVSSEGGAGGWWGAASIIALDVYGASSTLTFNIEDGRVVSVVAAGSHATSSGAGTEGDPGEAAIEIEDTDTVA